ncbi:nuclear transcription factor Y subunit C-2 [Andrographis paniculata]|uniref:nuclear transcription factor Y subunit C-2 n=1 Tax=Andrographis paniculata TaxID=175694 RepID=UPI0021E6E52C|nr:nuclear transcription factor Y subunit C-2 [Andrographis paniculata]
MAEQYSQQAYAASPPEQLAAFWAEQMQEAEQAREFKNQSLPLARIKKIMKADEDVRMISAEAPVVFAKACEMFILELTLRSWIHTEENKRRTLQKNDIAAAIARTDVFDFLVDIIPRDDDATSARSGTTGAGIPLPSAAADAISSYYYAPPAAAPPPPPMPFMWPPRHHQSES